MILVGYIDESISDEIHPLTFGLSCVFAYGSDWSWIELAWKKLLEEKNQELLAAGRKTVQRFHAVDMSNFAEDFVGWGGAERTAFTDRLIKKVFAKHDIYHVGYTVSLRDVAETWPNYAKRTKNFAYYSILKILMIELSSIINELFIPGTQISLIHDRSAYDGVLLEAFNSIKDDPKFELRNIFTDIAPMGWEDCILLQPADFVAYEVMKESHRLEPDVIQKKERPRRKSLEVLLATESFLGTAKSVPRESPIRIRESVTDRIAARIVAESEEK